MKLVLVSIAGPLGDRFERLRDGEIGIGHDSEIVVALSRMPIVARFEDVAGLLQQYYGPNGPVALSTRPDATDDAIAHYAAMDGAHGLEWTWLDDVPADILVDHRWYDQDDRSIYLARAILDGRLSNATEEERDLAVSWSALDEGLVEERPRYGIRETPVRAQIRALIFELERDLAAAGGEPRNWAREGERHYLPDESVCVVEPVRSDGGTYAGWYCLSRYVIRDRRHALIERAYLG